MAAGTGVNQLTFFLALVNEKISPRGASLGGVLLLY